MNHQIQLPPQFAGEETAAWLNHQGRFAREKSTDLVKSPGAKRRRAKTPGEIAWRKGKGMILAVKVEECLSRPPLNTLLRTRGQRIRGATRGLARPRSLVFGIKGAKVSDPRAPISDSFRPPSVPYRPRLSHRPSHINFPYTTVTLEGSLQLFYN